MTDWLAGSYGLDMSGLGDGIVALRSRIDGVLEVVGVVDATPSPSALLSYGDHLYAVIEGPGEGFVQSWRRSGTALELDGRASSGGSMPCNLAIFEGRLVAANYGDGALGIIGLDAAGAVTTLQQAIPGPTGDPGPHPDQGNSRQHAAFVTDDNVLVSLDLGADELQLHRLENDEVVRYDSFALPKGTGPRDIVRHPSGLIVVLGELDATMHLLSWDPTRATFALLDSVEMPRVHREHAAALAIGPGGRFVYTSLRRSNRLAWVEVDSVARTLRYAGAMDGGGEWGRHVAIDGSFLYVANQVSNEVSSFILDLDDGTPVEASRRAAIGSPTFLLRVG